MKLYCINSGFITDFDFFNYGLWFPQLWTLVSYARSAKKMIVITVK